MAKAAGGWVKKAIDRGTGGTGVIGEANRQRLLWGGRAAAKRLEARVRKLEERSLPADINPDNLSDNFEDIGRVSNKLDTLLNPLNVKNVTVTQINAGNGKKDILYARRMTETNTKLLKAFTKATIDIANNTKVIKKQNTDIKKGAKKPNKNTINLKRLKAKGESEEPLGFLAKIWDSLKNMVSEFLPFALAGLLPSVLSTILGATGITALKNKLTKLGPKKLSKSKGNRPKKLSKKLNQSKTKTKPSKKPKTGLKNRKSRLIKGSFNKIKKIISRVISKLSPRIIKMVGRKLLWRILIIAGGIVGGVLLGTVGTFIATAATAASAAFLLYEVTTYCYDLYTDMSPEQKAKIAETAQDWIDYGKEMFSNFANTFDELLFGTKEEQEFKEQGSITDELRFMLHDYEKNGDTNSREYKEVKRKFKEAVSKYDKLATALNAPIYIKSKLVSSTWGWGIFNAFNPYTQKELLHEINWIKNIIGQKNQPVKLNTTKPSPAKLPTISPKTFDNLRYNFNKESGVFMSKPVNTQRIAKTASGISGTSKDPRVNLALLGSWGIPFVRNIPGLADAYWSGLRVDESFRKFIDLIETGGTGDYTKKSARSNAYGRYQFTPATAARYAKKIGIPKDQWKLPINQDKMFQALVDDNIKSIKSKGLPVDIMTLWVAHNLGPGSLRFMFGDNSSYYAKKKQSFNEIKNQLPNKGKDVKDIFQARLLYMTIYRQKALKMISGLKPIDLDTKQKVNKVTTGGISRTTGSTKSVSTSVSVPKSGQDTFKPHVTSYNKVKQKFDQTTLRSNNFGSLKDYASQFVGRQYSQTARGIQGDVVLASSNSYDCSSLAALFAQDYFGIPMRTFGSNTEDQLKYLKKNAKRVRDFSQVEAGDFLVYSFDGTPASHIAIAVSKTERIHAAGRKKGVLFDRIDGSKNGLVGIFRVQVDRSKIVHKNSNGFTSYKPTTATLTPNTPGGASTSTTRINQMIKNIVSPSIPSNNTKKVSIFNSSNNHVSKLNNLTLKGTFIDFDIKDAWV